MRNATAARAAPAALVARARAGKPGTCILCLCVEERACAGGCAWVVGSDRRLCTAHTAVELRQGHAALLVAGEEARREG